MSKFFSLLLIIPLFFLLIVFFAGSTIMKADFQEFEEYRLQKTNNYATDAAVEEMLYADNLDQDYSDMSKVTLNPELARDTYLRVLASTYDIPMTKESLDSLSAQYMDLMIVCVYDGYYIISNEPTIDESTGHTEYTAIPSIKYPYYYSDPRDSGVYSLDLGFEKALYLSPTGLQEVDTPLSKNKTLSVINQLINKEINSRLMYKVQNGLIKAIDIPVTATTVGSVNNNIENVSVISFLNGVNFTTQHELNAFSIGGAKIDKTRMVACYRRNGKKYYAYTDLIPSSVAVPDNIRTWADYVVTSIEEAAEMGYYCDYELMSGGGIDD